MKHEMVKNKPLKRAQFTNRTPPNSASRHGPDPEIWATEDVGICVQGNAGDGLMNVKDRRVCSAVKGELAPVKVLSALFLRFGEPLPGTCITDNSSQMPDTLWTTWPCCTSRLLHSASVRVPLFLHRQSNAAMLKALQGRRRRQRDTSKLGSSMTPCFSLGVPCARLEIMGALDSHMSA